IDATAIFLRKPVSSEVQGFFPSDAYSRAKKDLSLTILGLIFIKCKLGLLWKLHTNLEVPLILGGFDKL
ncbi:hypothetical protein NL449_27765, partial [Klebsiella pneumoniae]|nr:hypothetical protein [Klebsiella pneumoniae]